MDNQQAKQLLDMGWLVGFYEGEGCFSLNKQKYRHQKSTIRPRITISSTDYELSEKAADILNDLGVGRYMFQRIRLAERHKNQLEVTVIGVKRCQKFLGILIPYMTESRKRICANTLLEYCDLRLSKHRQAPYEQEEFSLWQRLRDLNGYQLRQSLRDSTRDVFEYNTKVESAS